MESFFVCLVLLQGMYTESPSYNRKVDSMIPYRLEVCVEVLETAEANGVDSTLAVAVAWHESRFRKKITSKAGAVGPLQVLPQYWCPNKQEKGCDLILSGVMALKRYTSRYPIKEALCRYNVGNRGCKSKRATRYAETVLETFKRLSFSRWMLFS